MDSLSEERSSVPVIRVISTRSKGDEYSNRRRGRVMTGTSQAVHMEGNDISHGNQKEKWSGREDLNLFTPCKTCNIIKSLEAIGFHFTGTSPKMDFRRIVLTD